MSDEREGVPIDDESDALDEHVEEPIEPFHHSTPGVVGAAMIGLAKGMGMWVEPEEVAVIREAGAPPRDADDPIEVTIDPDDPTNSRIVFHVRADEARDPPIPG